MPAMSAGMTSQDIASIGLRGIVLTPGACCLPAFRPLGSCGRINASNGSVTGESMDLTRKLKPPFRAEHIGSFVRPDNLLNAARALKAGKIGNDELKRVADEAIVEIVRFQEDIGMPSVTDGEFRRRSWSAGFIDAVEGFGLREGTIEFRTRSAGKGAELSPYAKARLQRRRGIAADEFAFLKSVVRKGTPKTTIPAPDVMHYFLGPRAVDD